MIIRQGFTLSAFLASDFEPLFCCFFFFIANNLVIGTVSIRNRVKLFFNNRIFNFLALKLLDNGGLIIYIQMMVNVRINCINSIFNCLDETMTALVIKKKTKIKTKRKKKLFVRLGLVHLNIQRLQTKLKLIAIVVLF